MTEAWKVPPRAQRQECLGFGVSKEDRRKGRYFCLSVYVEAKDLGFNTTSVLEFLSLCKQADDLSNPFGQMSLSRQGSTEAADPSSALFQPPLISQHPQQTSFIMASTGQPLATSNYSTSSHAPPTQQVLPPQGYMQPPQQVSSSGSQLKSLIHLILSSFNWDTRGIPIPYLHFSTLYLKIVFLVRKLFFCLKLVYQHCKCRPKISIYRFLAISPDVFNSLWMLILNLRDLLIHVFLLTIDPGFLLSHWTVS